MSAIASRFRCHGCGAVVGSVDAAATPFRCPNRGRGDVDHVLVRELPDGVPPFPSADDEPNPFLRFRELFHVRHVARAQGLSDDGLDELIRRLDDRVAAVAGTGFRVTPFGRSRSLSEALGFSDRGGVWIKDETGNVAGSQKARHLFGVLVYLEASRRWTAGDAARPPLAIASCGNAALAAAVVARAGGWKLRVFVPESADHEVVRALGELSAEVVTCRRSSGEAGDPCVHAFRNAVDHGALPFTCQGNENGLAIEGGHTLGWEMASALGPDDGDTLDHVVVQVGGGALASAVAASLRESVAGGALARVPRLHTVQTTGAHPLERAHTRIVKRMAESGESVAEALRHAATHRSQYMWPWETTPASLAEGILDDETYDWWEVLRATAETGGQSLVVDEDAIRHANDLARAEGGFQVGYTGSAGLAGLKTLRAQGVIHPDQRVAVLMTGALRGRGG